MAKTVRSVRFGKDSREATLGFDHVFGEIELISVHNESSIQDGWSSL